MVDHLHVFIEGSVQGVGFRYATCRQAAALSLTGWVANLWDGRVEAEFEGDKQRLEQMLAWCRQGPAFARVTHVEARWETTAAKHADFHVR